MSWSTLWNDIALLSAKSTRNFAVQNISLAYANEDSGRGQTSLSVVLEPGFLQHPLPTVGLLMDETAELVRGLDDRERAGSLQFLPHGRIGQDFGDLALELVDDRGRRALGGDEAEPDRHVLEIGQSGGICQRRDAGHEGRRDAIKPCQSPDLAALDQRADRDMRAVDEV